MHSVQRWGKVDYVHLISSEAERPPHLVSCILSYANEVL